MQSKGQKPNLRVGTRCKHQVLLLLQSSALLRCTTCFSTIYEVHEVNLMPWHHNNLGKGRKYDNVVMRYCYDYILRVCVLQRVTSRQQSQDKYSIPAFFVWRDLSKQSPEIPARCLGAINSIWMLRLGTYSVMSHLNFDTWHRLYAHSTFPVTKVHPWSCLNPNLGTRDLTGFLRAGRPHMLEKSGMRVYWVRHVAIDVYARWCIRNTDADGHRGNTGARQH